MIISRNFKRSFVLLFIIGLALQMAVARTQRESTPAKKGSINPALFMHLEWRNIGPANMMGRTTDIEGVPGNPNIVYVGTASGGIWKTTNAAITWKPIFDELEKEFKSGLAEANQYLGQTVKEINNELIKHQLPSLFIPDQIKFEIK